MASSLHLQQKSPYDLIQERYLDDPWRIMIVCIMLNLTRGCQVKGVIEEFFRKYPTPEQCAAADHDELTALIKPLGLWKRRDGSLVKFSTAWLGQWKDVRDLPGIGDYAYDAWQIFVEGAVPSPVQVHDHKLKDYSAWAHSLAVDRKE